MNHAEFFHHQILENAPPGDPVQDPESGSDHHWYRVRVPILRDIAKRWIKQHGDTLSYEEWESTLDALYHSESIDERQIAGMLLAGFPKFRRKLPLKQLDHWLAQLVGWKEIDSNCQSTFSAEDLLHDWESWKSFLTQLSTDKNIQKRRASLVLLTKPIRSPHKRFLHTALSQIDTLKPENDKLITKAISWLLRTAISQHPEEIDRYLAANTETLPAIALRETRRKLATGKK